MTLTWSLFAFVSACVKMSYAYTDYNVTFFFQNFGGFLFVALVFVRPNTKLFDTPRIRTILARSLFGTLSFYLYFYTISFLPLTDGTLLNNTAPLFVPMILKIWKKQLTPTKIWISSCIGFIGILFILKPTYKLFQPLALVGLLSGVGSAIVMILIRQLAKENAKRVVLTYLLIASLLSFPLAAPFFSTLPPLLLPFLLFIGFLFGAVQIAYTKAFSYGEAALLAPFSYMFVLMSAVLEWFFWGKIPLWSTGVGMGLIVVGGILSVLWGKDPSEEMRTERDSNP